jgi:pyrroloquinoline quinone biosynthesis protein D
MNDACQGAEGIISLGHSVRFQFEPAQQAHVLLYPEGMIRLNDSAAEILKYCDGTRTAAGIIAELKRRFPDADLTAHVHEFLETAHGRGWIARS